ncbi:hypothetical protein BaRGS_00033741 [Batillaria attramentaria]|uniref:Carboxylic ester hydrolase n=1 Tax=Batillaria attramentaria TaxID=370345 RepID=A0ABD0JJ79_9CAEN
MARIHVTVSLSVLLAVAGLQSACVHCYVTGVGEEEGPVVTTRYGKIQGLYADNATLFLGVPFAAPPVGSLRWEAPQDSKSWGENVYNATTYKPACPQFHCETLSPPLVCHKKMAEDCLYLDIYGPRLTSASGLPVMVMIHGGNFVHMSGSSPIFDGRYLASSREIILVNINYRMGALGFLVTGETTNDARGNYGIQDQVMALKWVQENIHAFGGDPSKVTLFGQSAGAQSTLIHLTLPESAPYFRNAIVESSPIAIPYKRFPEAIILGGLFAELVGCQPRNMNCLRSKSANEITYAQYLARSKVSSLKLLEFFEPWGPFVDGQFIKAEPLALIREGQFSRKPLIIGTTSEETVLYVYSAWNTSVNNVLYGEVIVATYPGHAVEIIYMYPPSYPRDERDTMVKMSTDLVFLCPTRNATRIMRASGVSDVWMYVWDHAFSFQGWGPITFCEGRVCHGSEIVFLFHTEAKGNFTFTPEEKVLSEEIMDFWTNFAKTGDPNNPGRNSTGNKSGRSATALQWPVYAQDGDWPAFRFKTPASIIDTNYHGPYCDFWDTIGYAA